MQPWGQNTANLRTFRSRENAKPTANKHAVLRELFELLEDYAPAWYTEEHHNRAAAALGELCTEAAIN